MNNKKTIIILILILTIGIVGLTIAYFSNSSTITNTFNTNPYGTTVTEEFVSPDNWLPGTKTDKTLTVTNSGQVDEAVRISYTEVWTSKTAKNNNEEGDLPLQQNGNSAALIHFTNTDDWTTVTENGTTYRYYNYKLAPNNTTSELLDYVTFNPAITNSSNCTTNETNGTKTITCNSTGTGYDDATYKLTFTIETVQYDKYKEAWNTNVNIIEEKPLIVYGLNVNRKSKTYETGDKHQMFEFEHPATEQTPALTDYRYIGNDPYNYVKFNCDNDGTNCEIWRIIGVFSVDDGEGNWEQRIKLVRGSALSETMAWDTRNTTNEGGWEGSGKNDWNGSDLEVFLNGDYLNRENSASTYGLKALAQSQIDDIKYYLGGYSRQSSSPRYGSTEDMYNWERGNETYSYDNYCLYNTWDTTTCASNYCENNPTAEICNIIRSKSWVGKVTLLYPSDYGYTYSKGVDSGCFLDPNLCFYREAEISGTSYYAGNYNYPEIGWIFNSNNLEGQTGSSFNWLVSPSSQYRDYSFGMNSGGSLEDNYSTNNVSLGVRPVLYLKPSIQILSGTGQENDPYVLSN